VTRPRQGWVVVWVLVALGACAPLGTNLDDRPPVDGRSRSSPRSSVLPGLAPTLSLPDDSGPTSTPKPSPIPRARVLGERRVSAVPRSVSDRAWEPVVATHPTDPDRIAVIYEHRGPGAACSINPLIRISRDGGRTWRRTPSTPGARSKRGMGLHAAIAWGPLPNGRARLYWANMTSPGCGTGRFRLATSYSDDEGRTWSRLRVERSTPPWVGGMPDIAVDRDPRSPNHGTVYVAYNWLDGHGPGFRILASSDHGRTWRHAEVPPVKPAKRARDWWRIAYRLRPAPDGSVYATWYQVDLRRWDRTSIFAKGGAGNVERLGVGMARATFDRRLGTFHIGRSRLVASVRETTWTTSGASASGTAGNIRPDPMWQYGFDVAPDGTLHVAVGEYGPGQGGRPRGTIKVGASHDRGRTWTYTTLGSAPDLHGRRQSSLRPNLVAGAGYVVVTMRLLDDVSRRATMGLAFAVSSDGGRSWGRPRHIGTTRWWASDLGGVVNGAGLRERAERTTDGDVFLAYGDARLAGREPGKTAIFGTRIDLGTP